MVKQHVWRLVIVGCVLCWFAQAGRAADKQLTPKAAELRAKAALALASAARPAVAAVPVPAPAPMPREKGACEGRCNCPDCKCRPGACPAPKAIPAAQSAVPLPMPRREVWAGYGLVEFRGGQWWRVECPNGQCPPR